MTKEEAAKAACQAVRNLAIEVGIPQHLSEIGIKESDIPALAEQAIADVCTPGNPRDVTKEDIIDLYRQVL
jgi:lactaldehyde reductase